MDITIRPITKEEIDAFQEVADSVMETCFPEYPEDIKPRILKEDLNISLRMEVPDFTHWGAFVDGKAVGLLAGMNPIGGILNIHWIIVLKEYQGKGIGKKLLEEHTEWAKTKGAHALHLFAPDFNVPFYEKMGFENVGLVRKNFWGADDYFMNKVL
jgi:GNAT superfamily N-acetyltransferase